LPNLPPGLYDLPITNEIERELQQLDRTTLAADRQDLDPADADLAFARHLAALVRHSLADVHDVTRQAEIVNELLVVEGQGVATTTPCPASVRTDLSV
jgi:hypothetical protein